MGFTKKSFAVELSKLKVFEKPKANLEQYSTDSEVAAVMLWNAGLNNDIEGKNIVDLGAGTGVLGLGCLLLGAKKATFVDIDKSALDVAKENYDALKKEFDIENAKVEFKVSDIESFEENFDVVVQNPPFGVQEEHADKKFLQKAFTLAPIIYTMHKAESKDFIEKFSEDKGFEITSHKEMSFPIKQTMKYHKKKIHRFLIGVFRLKKRI